MKWIDQAGYAAAVAWSGHYSVTVAVGGIRFVAPIRISDLVTVAVKLVYTGTSSMHFLVEVRARDPMQPPDQDRLCTHCVIVFVAMDQAEGRPMAVPAWTPVDQEDRSLHEYAQKVMPGRASSRRVAGAAQAGDAGPNGRSRPGRFVTSAARGRLHRDRRACMNLPLQ